MTKSAVLAPNTEITSSGYNPVYYQFLTFKYTCAPKKENVNYRDAAKDLYDKGRDSELYSSKLKIVQLPNYLWGSHLILLVSKF